MGTSPGETGGGPACDRAPALEVFQRHRPRLFGVAYRMLGSVQDAEDLVQEAYLRWHQADAGEIRSPEAWLVAVTTRLAIDRLRRAATERAAHVGCWLPEPITTGEFADPDRSSDLSLAFLVVLERLSPDERAAFILREVLECEYAEIAAALEKSETACRQLVHRARARVRRDEPRYPVGPEARSRLLERFLTALAAEDRDALVGIMAEDVSWTADGGGKTPATSRVVRGADRVARMLLGWERKGRGLVTHRMGEVNGEPAIISLLEGKVFAATAFEFQADRIAACYRVLNPDKLGHVQA